jgi:hypothetical protein
MSIGKTYVFLVVAVVMVVVATYSVNIAQAQQKPQIIFPVAGATFEIALVRLFTIPLTQLT